MCEWTAYPRIPSPVGVLFFFVICIHVAVVEKSRLNVVNEWKFQAAYELLVKRDRNLFTTRKSSNLVGIFFVEILKHKILQKLDNGEVGANGANARARAKEVRGIGIDFVIRRRLNTVLNIARYDVAYFAYLIIFRRVCSLREFAISGPYCGNASLR